MKKFLHSDWLRAVQFFFLIVQKRLNSLQKEETNQAFWLVSDQRNSQMANQIFCFQIKRTPWMAQLETLSLTFRANEKRQDEISFSPKHGETWFN